ncbi:uncharacterized protein LOC119042781 [Artibeus jamaicensis]|uniref:uncharacterized protein LOC119042781 n=1 Tax=Artibeus jamaicensis TaxID=9417 RepID=UPI00235A8FC9|nr:uncharacterized protein LOC119042781 [Artibeus jamaicensis]
MPIIVPASLNASRFPQMGCVLLLLLGTKSTETSAVSFARSQDVFQRIETAFHKGEACSETTSTAEPPTSLQASPPLPGGTPGAEGQHLPVAQRLEQDEGPKLRGAPPPHPQRPALPPEALSYLHQCPITLANSQEIN